MPGAVLIVIVLVLVGPVAVMLGGAAWSAAFGWRVGADADERADSSRATTTTS